MSTKKLNQQALQEELSGSAFFKNRLSETSELARVAPTRWARRQPTDLSTSTAVKTESDTTAAIQEDFPTSSLQSERSTGRSGERTNVRSFDSPERLKSRTKVRHSFDVYEDQLLSLREIGLARERLSGKRVQIGELAQEALDKLISSERSTERTDEHPNITTTDDGEASESRSL